MKNRFLLISICAVILVNVALYYRTTGYGFVDYDDPKYINDNTQIHELSGKNIKQMFTGFYFENYQPLVLLSYAVDYKFSGLGGKSYHVTNIILHITNSLLVMILVCMITGSGWAALIVALFFSVHPIQVETVAWVSERKGLMCTLFYLLSFISYIKSVKLEKSKYYLLSIVLFLLAMLSKPMAVTLPLTLFLYDYFITKRGPINLTNLTAYLRRVAPYLAIALIFSAVTVAAQEVGGMDKTSSYFNILFALYSIGFYFAKLLIPLNLSMHYAYPENVDNLSCVYIIAALNVIALIVYLIKHKKLSDMANFGFMFFLVSILPILKFVPIGNTYASDRYMYVPMVGFFAAVVVLGSAFIKKRPALKMPLSVILVVYLLILSASSYARIPVWGDNLALWSDVLSKDPEDSTARYKIEKHYYHTGVALSKKRQYSDAIGYYKKAVNMVDVSVPHERDLLANVYSNLGNAYMQIGDIVNAEQALKDAIKSKDGLVTAYNSLGYVYIMQKEYGKARDVLKRGLVLSPNYASAHTNLGTAYLNLRDHDSALKHFNKSLELNPNSPFPHKGLGQVYKATGDSKRALEHLRRAKSINPNDPEVDATILELGKR